MNEQFTEEELDFLMQPCDFKMEIGSAAMLFRTLVHSLEKMKECGCATCKVQLPAGEQLINQFVQSILDGGLTEKEFQKAADILYNKPPAKHDPIAAIEQHLKTNKPKYEA